MALEPENPVVGGTFLRRTAIQSPDYVQGTSGWSVNQDGTAELNSATIRGTVIATQFAGTDFVINAQGIFIYTAGA